MCLLFFQGYNVYSEPWRKESNLASNIYRPGKNIDKEAYGGQEDLDELRKTNRYVLIFFCNYQIISN